MTLQQYLRKTKIHPATLAARLGVARYTVDRYLCGRVPTPEMMRRIYVVTGGRVTPNDLVLRAGQ